MAITTENTFLMIGTTESSTTTYSKLLDIKEFPDLGGEPATVEITTLSDHIHKYLMGLKDPGMLTFTCNYDSEDFDKVNNLSGTQSFAIWFGAKDGQPDGSAGKFEFTGEASVWVNSGSVEAAVEMSVAIAVNSEITKA